MNASSIAEAAERLAEASSSATACAPVRELIGSNDVNVAYAVQDALTLRRVEAGARVVGRAIALTYPVVQDQPAGDGPGFGIVFDDMLLSDTESVALESLIAPRVQGGVAFVLGSDLEDPRTSIIDVLRATDFLLPALEIVDSRIVDWDITIVDSIADNSSSGAVVLGTTAIDPVGLDLTEVALRLDTRGVVVASGTGAACLGSPVRALAWLARECVRRGRPLAAGEVVMSGAFGPMVSVDQPSTFRAELSSMGHVEVNFEGAKR